MTEEIAGWFEKFVEAKLVKRGFKVVAPWLAERRANGVRQGIMWTQIEEKDPSLSMVKVRTFQTFDHELDDGPGGRIKPFEAAPVCAQLSGELGVMGNYGRASFL